jgi:signal transduction histidine kinase
VTILISDTGKGMDSQTANQIFEPGYTTKKRGWGLGLPLSKRIMESYHHGKLFVKHTEPLKGTTFCLQLPIAQ